MDTPVFEKRTRGSFVFLSNGHLSVCTEMSDGKCFHLLFCTDFTADIVDTLTRKT